MKVTVRNTTVLIQMRNTTMSERDGMRVSIAITEARGEASSGRTVLIKAGVDPLIIRVEEGGAITPIIKIEGTIAGTVFQKDEVGMAGGVVGMIAGTGTMMVAIDQGDEEVGQTMEVDLSMERVAGREVEGEEAAQIGFIAVTLQDITIVAGLCPEMDESIMEMSSMAVNVEEATKKILTTIVVDLTLVAISPPLLLRDTTMSTRHTSTHESHSIVSTWQSYTSKPKMEERLVENSGRVAELVIEDTVILSIVRAESPGSTCRVARIMALKRWATIDIHPGGSTVELRSVPLITWVRDRLWMMDTIARRNTRG